MSKSSETRKIEAKEREWKSEVDEFFDKVRSWKKKWFKYIRKKLLKSLIKFINWLFFYVPDNKMDAIVHVITVISWIIVGVFIATH